MCGIAGIHRRTDAPVAKINTLADALLLGIAHRGSDATGCLALADDGSMDVQKLTEPCARFVIGRRRFHRAARTVLLHTRFATRGAADDPRNAHPVQAGKAAAIHNGTIGNDSDLFARHGMKRTAAVDSIVIPALVDHLGWANARKALSQLRGGAATAVVHADHPTEVLLARTRTYPMHVLVTDDVIVWASERRTIEGAWRYTYGRAPHGEWLELAEWSALHINGKVRPLALDKPKDPPKKKQAPWPPSRVQAGRHTAAKPRRRRRKRDDTPTPPPALMLPLEHEPWMDDVVRDLMRQDGMSYDDAYEAVYGHQSPLIDSLIDSLEWDDDTLVYRGRAD